MRKSRRTSRRSRAVDDVVQTLELQLAGDAPVWRRKAERKGLAEPGLVRQASSWCTDAALGRPLEVVTDKDKSRRLGVPAPRRQPLFDRQARLRFGARPSLW